MRHVNKPGCLRTEAAQKIKLSSTSECRGGGQDEHQVRVSFLKFSLKDPEGVVEVRLVLRLVPSEEWIARCAPRVPLLSTEQWGCLVPEEEGCKQVELSFIQAGSQGVGVFFCMNPQSHERIGNVNHDQFPAIGGARPVRLPLFEDVPHHVHGVPGSRQHQFLLSFPWERLRSMPLGFVLTMRPKRETVPWPIRFSAYRAVVRDLRHVGPRLPHLYRPFAFISGFLRTSRSDVRCPRVHLLVPN